MWLTSHNIQLSPAKICMKLNAVQYVSLATFPVKFFIHCSNSKCGVRRKWVGGWGLGTGDEDREQN